MYVCSQFMLISVLGDLRTLFILGSNLSPHQSPGSWILKPEGRVLNFSSDTRAVCLWANYLNPLCPSFLSWKEKIKNTITYHIVFCVNQISIHIKSLRKIVDP